jgi:hypothetical protein
MLVAHTHKNRLLGQLNIRHRTAIHGPLVIAARGTC